MMYVFSLLSLSLSFLLSFLSSPSPIFFSPYPSSSINHFVDKRHEFCRNDFRMVSRNTFRSFCLDFRFRCIRPSSLPSPSPPLSLYPSPLPSLSLLFSFSFLPPLPTTYFLFVVWHFTAGSVRLPQQFPFSCFLSKWAIYNFLFVASWPNCPFWGRRHGNLPISHFCLNCR